MIYSQMTGRRNGKQGAATVFILMCGLFNGIGWKAV